MNAVGDRGAPPPAAEPAPAGSPESRDLAKRTGLCAAFTLNLVVFALPAHLGLEESSTYARLFGTLAMLFGTLSVLAGGSYFIARAARALRDRVVRLDLPIALALLGAYAGSCYGWLAPDPRFVHFDLVGAFILLLLAGRWAQVAAAERARRRGGRAAG